MRISVEGVVTSIEETNATVHGLANAQQEVSESAKETLRGLQGNASGLQELAASIAGIDKDTQVLAASAESTAAALEQVRVPSRASRRSRPTSAPRVNSFRPPRVRPA